MADLLILSDVVDLSRGISLIFLAARGTGPAPALLHSVTSITPGWPFAALYQPDIVVVPVLIVVRVLVEDARCRAAAPGAKGVFFNLDLPGGNMAGTAAPPSQVFPVLINGVVEVRHSEPLLNFMIVHFFQPLLCDITIFLRDVNANIIALVNLCHLCGSTGAAEGVKYRISFVAP